MYLLKSLKRLKKSIDSGIYGCQHLLMKLQHYGIRNNMLSWLKSYLTDRKQYVSFNGQNSEMLEINCGVPTVLSWDHYSFYYILITLLTSARFLSFIYLLMLPICIMNRNHMGKTINKELSKLYLWLNIIVCH